MAILASGGTSVAVLDTAAPYNVNFSWTEPFPINALNIAFFCAKPPQSQVSAFPAGWTGLGGIASGTSTAVTNDGGAVWLELAYKKKTTETVSSEPFAATGQLNPGITGNVIASTTSAVSYTSKVMADDPEVYLHLYGSSSSSAFVDDSGHGRDGSYGGTGTSYSRAGLILGEPQTGNDCVQLTGSSYVLWNTPTWLPNSGFTAEAWVKLTSLATTQSIWQRDGVDNRLWQFMIVGSKLQLTVWTDGGGPFTATGATTLVVGRTYYVAASYSSATGKLTVYLDGAPDGTATVTGGYRTLATGTANLQLAGGYSGTASITNYLTGYLDEPAMYAAALSDAQILSHYTTAAVSRDAPWGISATFGADTDKTTTTVSVTCGTTLPFTTGDMVLVVTGNHYSDQLFYDNADMFTIPGCVVPQYPTSLTTFNTSTGGNANVRAYWYTVLSGTATGPPQLSTYSSSTPTATALAMAVVRLVPPAGPTVPVAAVSADIAVISPPALVEVGKADPGKIVVESPPASIEIIEHVGEIAASLEVSVVTGAIMRAMTPASAASEGLTTLVEVQIWDPLNTELLAIVDGRLGMQWLDDLNDSGSGSFDMSRWDSKATPKNLALFNLVRYLYAGKTRFASRIEERKIVISGAGDFEAQVWHVSGRGILSLLSDAVLYPEYGVNEFTRKERGFFFGSERSAWYIPSEWVTPRGLPRSNIPPDHPWNALPADWPDPDAQWLSPTDPNQVANPGPVWFRTYFTLSKSTTVTIYVSADDQATVYLDGYPAVATVGGDRYAFRRTSQFSARLLPGQHLIAAEVINSSDSLEEVQPIVTSNEVRPSYASDSNIPYLHKGFTDGGHPYINSDGSVDSGWPGAAAFDGDPNTYWLSVGNYKGWTSAYEWVEGTFPAQVVTAVRVRLRGGPSTVYISLKNGGNEWNGEKVVPYRHRVVDAGSAIRYVREVRADPDSDVTINIPAQTADRIRITVSAEWDSGIWQYRWRSAIYDVIVTSESREGTYIRGGNFSGLLLTVTQTDDSGAITGVYHRSEPDGWLVKTGKRPGWRPAHILKRLIEEAMARNVLGILPLKLGFDDIMDSKGAIWTMPLKDVSYATGEDYLSIIKKLAEDSEMDVWIEPDTLTLHAAPKRGSDKTVGEELVVLRPGQSLLDFSIDSARPSATRLVVESEYGWLEIAEFETESAYGRVEGFVALGSALSAEETRSQAINELNRLALEHYDTTIKTTDVVGPRPYVDYDVGDMVLIPTSSGDSAELGKNRVLSFRIGEGDAGELDVTVEADRELQIEGAEVVPIPPVIGPPPVTALHTTDVSETSVTLSWTNPVTAEALAVPIVRRASGATPPSTSDSWAAVIGMDPGDESVTDSGLLPGATYSYAVWPADASGALTVTPTTTTVTTPHAAAIGYGVPAGTTLTTLTTENNPYAANELSAAVYQIDADGTFTGWRFEHRVEVRAGHVTFINCVFAGSTTDTAHGKGLLHVITSGTGTASAYGCTFAPTAPYDGIDGVMGCRFAVEWCDVSGTVDGVHAWADGSVTVNNTWLHDFIYYDNNSNPGDAITGTHTDGIQVGGGSYYTFMSNLFNGTMRSTGILISQELSMTKEVLIEDNIFDITNNFADVHADDLGGVGPITGLVIKDNLFKHDETKSQMLITSRTYDRVSTAIVGNVWIGGATPPPSVDVDTSAPTDLVLSDILVPSRGVLWGAVGDAKGPTQGPTGHRNLEAATGRTIGLYSSYYRAGSLWPNSAEMALANEPGKKRILLMNWRIASDSTWAAVASGSLDVRINNQISHLKAKFPTEKFFMTLHQEMEPEVNLTAGSGMQPSDYAAMFRYVVNKFRAAGVGNMVPVMAYMAFPRWPNEPWFDDLWPGDTYVSWISWDPYAWSPVQTWSPATFADLLNYDGAIPGYPGFYDFITAKHPGYPLLLGEWGVFESIQNQTACYVDKSKGLLYSADCQPVGTSTMAQFINTVNTSLNTINVDFPAIKAMVFFETEIGSQGNTRFTANSQIMSSFNKPAVLTAFQTLSTNSNAVNPPN